MNNAASRTAPLVAAAPATAPLVAAQSKDPTLDVEQAAFTQNIQAVIGVDEVGRGALAGPVAVGAHAVFHGTREFPQGLRDSKLLSEKRRETLAPLVLDWGAGAVGYASPAEIDELGITRALGLAGRRALLQLHELLRTAGASVTVTEALILLDGKHDWLTPALKSPLNIHTRVGADRACASVAAASVRAKVERDTLMREADATHPGYAWSSNKGYGSRAHLDGLQKLGLTDLHRKSFLRAYQPKPAEQ